MSLLALFALALQLGLSFGHVHTGEFALSSAQASLTNNPSPASSPDQDAGNDVCAVCATIAMANTVVDSAPPALPLPLITHGAPIVIAAALDSERLQRLFFQSRAPPRS